MVLSGLVLMSVAFLALIVASHLMLMSGDLPPYAIYMAGDTVDIRQCLSYGILEDGVFICGLLTLVGTAWLGNLTLPIATYTLSIYSMI